MSFPSFPGQYARLLRPGDVLLLVLVSLVTAWLFFNAWGKPAGNAIMVRAHGKLMLHASLARDAEYTIPGKLGLSVIEVRQGRARVASDPGPKQICVRQGWLSRAGEAALCLANQVTVEIVGAGRPFDSLSF